MFPLFTNRCLHVRHDVRDPSGGSGNCGRECYQNFAEMTTSTPFRDLLYADGFTSPPKEGVLRIFSPLKIRRLRPGLNPRTWVLKASTLPLDHRSRFSLYATEHLKKKCVGYEYFLNFLRQFCSSNVYLDPDRSLYIPLIHWRITRTFILRHKSPNYWIYLLNSAVSAANVT